ncbi:MAG: site-specific integrase [Firmicutes bacterium]|nr:site-specific integrase [Bacillota bacterium]
MYRYAIAKDIVIKDETYSVLVPKSEVIEIKRNVETSYSELMEVIEGIQNSHMKENDSLLCQGALMIMYYTGLRPSETFALSSDDIDFSSMLIHVWKSVGTTSTEKNTIRKTKTECSIRYVPFSDELIPILKLLIDRSINGYLFKRDNGLFMDGTYLSNITRRISKGEFRPYQLRHQFSTDLITSGVDLRTAQELMGHKEVNMTVSYARSNENLKRLAITNRNKN